MITLSARRVFSSLKLCKALAPVEPVRCMYNGNQVIGALFIAAKEVAEKEWEARQPVPEQDIPIVIQECTFKGIAYAIELARMLPLDVPVSCPGEVQWLKKVS